MILLGHTPEPVAWPEIWFSLGQILYCRFLLQPLKKNQMTIKKKQLGYKLSTINFTRFSNKVCWHLVTTPITT